MARPTLFTHPKFRRLCHVLRQPDALVLGCLEFLWHVGYESGRALVGDAVDVELAARWPGEPGALTRSLCECGLLDEEDGRYSIHDLFDHAPEYVQQRAAREEERRKDKSCAGCDRTFHSPDPRARHCSPGCRLVAFRARQTDVKRIETDPSVSETDRNVSETDVKRIETDRNGTPLEEEVSSSLGQEEEIPPQPPQGGGGGGGDKKSSGKKEKPARTAPLPAALNTAAFRAAWSDWCVYRTERRHTLTPSTVKLQLAQLARWGEAAAIASIRQSIEAGWLKLVGPRSPPQAGLFAPPSEEELAEKVRRQREAAAAEAAAGARPPRKETP